MYVQMLTCALIAATTVACAKPEGDEAKIRKVLDQGAAALEARDVEKAVNALADDYADKRKRTRDQLKRITFFALQQGPVLVSIGDVAITVNGDNATAHVKALAVQGSGQLKTAKDLLPTNAKAFDLTVGFEKDGREWKVSSIEGDGAPSFGGE